MGKRRVRFAIVGCGVGDTPELWRGAAGLLFARVRVRACADAAESLHTYI